jgi:hypothetical protein
MAQILRCARTHAHLCAHTKRSELCQLRTTGIWVDSRALRYCRVCSHAMMNDRSTWFASGCVKRTSQTHGDLQAFFTPHQRPCHTAPSSLSHRTSFLITHWLPCHAASAPRPCRTSRRPSAGRPRHLRRSWTGCIAPCGRASASSDPAPIPLPPARLLDLAGQLHPNRRRPENQMYSSEKRSNTPG